MRFPFEGFEFELPFFTLLSGPMAAAKPLFAQKFIVRFLKGHSDYSVLYFATSSPVCGILRNLRVFGLEEKEKERIIFLDYHSSCESLKETDANYYIGNFSDKAQLMESLKLADEGTIVIVPSFTLLLVGTEDKQGLAEVLVRNLLKKKATSFVAVNSLMFEEINEMLAERADNVLEFLKRGDSVRIRTRKFRGQAPEGEIPFKFPREMFQSTKKEVAERTARIIREKKVM